MTSQYRRLFTIIVISIFLILLANNVVFAQDNDASDNQSIDQNPSVNISSSMPSNTDNTTILSDNATDNTSSGFPPVIIKTTLTETVTVSGPRPSSSTENSSDNTTKPATGGGISWMIIGIVGGVVVVFGFLLFFLLSRWRNSDDHYPRDTSYNAVNRLKEENASLRNRLTNAQQKYQHAEMELSQYKENLGKIPALLIGNKQLAEQVQQMGTSLNEPLALQLTNNSVGKDDYGAVRTQMVYLQTLNDYLVNLLEQQHKLKMECQQLISAIKVNGVDVSEYEQSLAAANMASLRVLKTTLLTVYERTKKVTVSPEIINDIATYKERVGHIRDYSYRIPPMHLIEFAENLVKDKVSAQEAPLREHTIREILNAVDRYLKL